METHNYTFRQILDESTKNELVEIKEFFNVPVAANKWKADIVDAIVKFFKEEPVSALLSFPIYELEILREIATEGKGGRMGIPYTDFPFFCEEFGMVDVSLSGPDNEDTVQYYTFLDDVYDWFSPHFDKAMKIAYDSGRMEFEDFFWGCLTVYGVITYQEFLDLIDKHCTNDLRSLAYYMSLRDFHVLEYCLEEGKYLCHPSVEDHHEILAEQRNKKIFGAKPAALSDDIILSAGRTAPWSMPLKEAQEGKALLDALAAIGYDRDTAVAAAIDIWEEVQWPDSDARSLNQLVQRILQGGRISRMEDVQKTVDAIMHYSNAVPRWGFKGRSADEMFTKDPYRNKKMATAGAMASQMQRNMQQASIHKVGRNDPCPCGSGLKYKNCHGKNLN